MLETGLNFFGVRVLMNFPEPSVNNRYNVRDGDSHGTVNTSSQDDQ